jgi:hypothetical protein
MLFVPTGSAGPTVALGDGGRINPARFARHGRASLIEPGTEALTEGSAKREECLGLLAASFCDGPIEWSQKQRAVT